MLRIVLHVFVTLILLVVERNGGHGRILLDYGSARTIKNVTNGLSHKTIGHRLDYNCSHTDHITQCEKCQNLNADTSACVVFASFTGESGTVAAYYLFVEGVTVLNNFFHDSSPFKFCQDNADGKVCLNFTSVDLKKPSACVTAIIDIPHFNGSLDYGCAVFPPPATKPDMPRNVQPGDKTSTYTGHRSNDILEQNLALHPSCALKENVSTCRMCETVGEPATSTRYCIVLESLVSQRNKIIMYMLLNQNGLPLSYRNITESKPFTFCTKTDDGETCSHFTDVNLPQLHACIDVDIRGAMFNGTMKHGCFQLPFVHSQEITGQDKQTL